MMSQASTKSFSQKSVMLLVRFIKFNLVGTVVFLVATAIYMISFNTFGFWAWLLANGLGGILQFSIITWLNRTKRGRIFDNSRQNSCP
jgi:hypothetical protein